MYIIVSYCIVSMVMISFWCNLSLHCFQRLRVCWRIVVTIFLPIECLGWLGLLVSFWDMLRINGYHNWDSLYSWNCWITIFSCDYNVSSDLEYFLVISVVLCLCGFRMDFIKSVRGWVSLVNLVSILCVSSLYYGPVFGSLWGVELFPFVVGIRDKVEI